MAEAKAKVNNNRIYKQVRLFMGTSDDLIFWGLVDILFLSVVKGYSTAEISLIFSISFWIALATKYPSYRIASKIDIASSVLISAIMFLCSAVLLTVSGSMVGIVIGMSLNNIAALFVNMGDVMLKETCELAEPKEDFVKAKTYSGTLYAYLSIATAMLVNPMMNINKYLPMICCIIFRIFSLVLAIRIKRGKAWGVEEQKAYIPKAFNRIQKFTLKYLLMAIAVYVFFVLAVTYMKLQLQDSLMSVFDEAKVVKYFSLIIVASRIGKLLGNYFLKYVSKFSNKYESVTNVFVLSLITIPCAGIYSCCSGGIKACISAGIGLILVNFLWDLKQTLVIQMMLDRLSRKFQIAILFTHEAMTGLGSALLSSLITLMLVRNSNIKVMYLLLLLSIVSIVFCIQAYRLKIVKQNRYELQWGEEEIAKFDSLVTATIILLSQYGFVKSTLVSPSRFISKYGSVENVDRLSSKIHYRGIVPFTQSSLSELYSDGQALAVHAYDGLEYRWYPLLYMDDEDGVVYNCYGDKRMLSDFDEINQIARFEID